MSSSQSSHHKPGFNEGAKQDRPSIRERFQLLKDTNFLVYWLSGQISWFGDMFALIAMPLLIVVMTEADAGTVGLVMAISGLPRVIFILFGGVLIDRFTAIKMVLWSRWTMAVTYGLFGLLAVTDRLEMWMVYTAATIAGTVGSFLFPAQMTLMPSIVDDKDLPAANALNTSTSQILQSFAPTIVGFLIAVLSGYDIMAPVGQKGDPALEMVAYGYAFLINAGTFVVSAAMLTYVVTKDEEERDHDSMLRSVLVGFQAVWQDPPLRAFIIYIALSQLFMMGNVVVGQRPRPPVPVGRGHVYVLGQGSHALAKLEASALARSLYALARVRPTLSAAAETEPLK